MLEEGLKVARKPFEYSVFDLVEEIKIKNRVKVDAVKKENYQHALTKTLNKTVTQNFGFLAKDNDRVMEMLEDSDLSKE